MKLEVDNHKLMYHPERVARFKETGDSFPIYVEIGLTNACNHKCVFCALDYLENGGIFIDKDILIKNLKDMSDHGVKSLMFAGEGEPLLHKDISLFVEKAKEFNMDISITTNGILFDKEKRERCLPHLSWIRFSIDSGTPENYSKIHGTNKKDFEILMENLKESVEFKKKNNLDVTIGTQFLMLSENFDQLFILAERLKKIGVDNLQVKPYSHHPESHNDYSVESAKYNELKSKLESLNSEDFRVYFREATLERINQGITYPECYGLPFFTLIDSKGNVIPCNLYYTDPNFWYGNLNNEIFSTIWTSERRKKIIQKLREKGVEHCRKGCRLDPVNRYLNRLKNPHPHDNFI